MMLGLFILLLITVVLAWIGYRRAAIVLLLITLIAAAAIFIHHMTNHLTINL